MPSPSFYEQPLNERIRLLMRLEFAFRHIDDNDQLPLAIHQHLTLSALLDLIDLVSRSDTTQEVVKELERIGTNLADWQDRPGVDAARLDNILDNVTSLGARLAAQGSRHYLTAANAELLAALRRRHNVTCGNTEFDQPVLGHWLLKPEQTRREHLQTWTQPFETLKLATRLVMQLIRESAEITQCEAAAGFHQHTLDTGQPVQLLRVSPEDPDCYPVISAGRHRFTIRFMTQHGDSPATQVETTAKFKLACCAL